MVVFKRLESHKDFPEEWLAVVYRFERFDINNDHVAVVRSDAS